MAWFLALLIVLMSFFFMDVLTTPMIVLSLVFLYTLYNLGMTVCFNPSPMTADLPKEYPLHLVDYLLINEIEAQGLYSYLTASKHDTDSHASSSHITASESLPVLEKAYEQISGIIITLGGDGLVARFRINEEDVNMKEFRMGIVKG